MNIEYVIAGAVLILWPISCVACLITGAIIYHAIRIVQTKNPVYRPVVPTGLQNRLLEKRMRALADKDSAALQSSYLNAIKGYNKETHVDPNEKTAFLEIPK